MAGFKAWAFKELLTSADLNNYLMRQAVPRFATQAARNSAITSPEAGMLAYTDDDKAVRQYVKPAAIGYWAPMPGTVVAELYQTSAQGIASGSYVPLNMHAFRVDRGYGALSNSTRFTPNVPGYYTLLAEFAIGQVATTTATASVGKNGVTQFGSYTMATTSATLVTALTSMPITVYANGTGDYFEAFGRLGSGGTINTAIGGVGCGLNVVYSGQ